MDFSTKRDVLTKRYKDFVSDINDMTLRDKLNQVPSEKAFWAMVLTDYERSLIKLETTRDTIIKKLSNNLIEKTKTPSLENPVSLPVSVNKTMLENLKNHESLHDINADIAELKLCVGLFTKIYDNIRYIARDFENILKFKQLQDS